MPAVRSEPAARTTIPWGPLGVASSAFAAVVVLGASPYAQYLHHEYQPSSASGQLAGVAFFLAGWGLMMLAMMLPSAAALLGHVARLADHGSARCRLQLLVGAGFMTTWIGVGCAFRVGDGLVHLAVDASGWLAARPNLIGGSALLVAGLFQFSSLKDRCLTACRTPAGFVYRHWHGEHTSWDAVRIGLAYGASCVGCCWALMLVLFGLGVASAVWMVALGAVIAAEKSTSVGGRLTRPVGIVLMAAALVFVLVGL